MIPAQTRIGRGSGGLAPGKTQSGTHRQGAALMIPAQTRIGRGSGGWPPGRHSLELTGKELRS
ncbi:hypothetical protein RKD28_005560 [Streptomyces sp. SAI-229]